MTEEENRILRADYDAQTVELLTLSGNFEATVQELRSARKRLEDRADDLTRLRSLHREILSARDSTIGRLQMMLGTAQNERDRAKRDLGVMTQDHERQRVDLAGYRSRDAEAVLLRGQLAESEKKLRVTQSARAAAEDDRMILDAEVSSLQRENSRMALEDAERDRWRPLLSVLGRIDKGGRSFLDAAEGLLRHIGLEDW
jgi:hypothetical protein